jgi:hypothetical protein
MLFLLGSGPRVRPSLTWHWAMSDLKIIIIIIIINFLVNPFPLHFLIFLNILPKTHIFAMGKNLELLITFIVANCFNY